MTTISSPIGRAVAELLTERENLAARLAKIDAAIATMRELFHLPNGRPVVKARAGRAAAPAPSTPTNGRGTISADAIRAALRDGPMKPGDLAKRLGVGRVPLRHALKPLEADRTVVITGVTMGRRVALPGRPAKEAP